MYLWVQCTTIYTCYNFYIMYGWRRRLLSIVLIFYNVDCVVLEDGIVQEAPVCFFFIIWQLQSNLYRYVLCFTMYWPVHKGWHTYSIIWRTTTRGRKHFNTSICCIKDVQRHIAQYVLVISWRSDLLIGENRPNNLQTLPHKFVSSTPGRAKCENRTRKFTGKGNECLCRRKSNKRCIPPPASTCKDHHTEWINS